MKTSVIVGGAAKDADLSVIIGGEEKEVYDAYVMVGGAAKLFYKRAVEWTSTISLEPSAEYVSDYGNSIIYSSFITIQNDTGNSITRNCTVTYTFKNSFTMQSGKTISIALTNNSSQGYAYVKINDQDINSGSAISQDMAYTFQADTIINTITVIRYVTKVEIGIGSGYTAVTVNSEDGSFLLNNSGTSDQ